MRVLAPGDWIDEYRMLALIASGGFGAVFRAEHEPSHRVVAIKVPLKEEGIPALRRSAEIQSALRDPGIVAVLGASPGYDPPYVVFEHVEGPTLATLLREEGWLPWRRAVPILCGVARALRYAHRRGFLHGDVKPANIILQGVPDHERPLLTDFGSVAVAPSGGDGDQVCCSVGLDTNERSEIVGTLPYAAPELLRGERIDEGADVWSFGVLIFETLTGVLPEGHELPRDLAPAVPAELDEAFVRCFSRRAHRARDFDAVLVLLEKTVRRAPVGPSLYVSSLRGPLSFGEARGPGTTCQFGR
jgi:serine/threonine protein kinase